MAGAIDTREIKMDTVSNDVEFTFFEKEIKDSTKFYEKHKAQFYQRPAEEAEEKPVIDEKAYKLLKEIYESLDKNKTSYKVIINPLYDQIKLNRKDLETLKSIFGPENVFDFSGKIQVWAI